MKASSMINPGAVVALGLNKGYNVNYNIAETENGFIFDYVVVSELSKSAIVSAIISTKYRTIADELAVINNRDIDEEHESEYQEYQSLRLFAKSVTKDIL